MTMLERISGVWDMKAIEMETICPGNFENISLEKFTLSQFSDQKVT